MTGVDRLRACDWIVEAILDHGTAARCIRAWHYSRSAANTSIYRHGLYPAGLVLAGDPYGVAMWMPPTRRAAESVAGDDWRGVLVLSRLAVAPEVPRNGASFLLGRSMRLIDRARWPVLLTYADTRLGHTGAIYRATNWIELGETAAGDVWVDESGRQRGRKRGAFNYTRAEMAAMGLRQAKRAAKVKFVHDARDSPLRSPESASERPRPQGDPNPARRARAARVGDVERP